MVNTGQPSDACIQCRLRRIKCDSTRPDCKRCAKYGITCPGYPQKGFVFRDDTAAIRERAHKKYEKTRHTRASAQSASIVREFPFISKSSMTVVRQSSNPPSQPFIRVIPASSAQLTKIALIDVAVAAFSSQWQNPNVNVWWGLLDVAAAEALTTTHSPGFGCALNAISLMALALRPEAKLLDLRKSAMAIYGETLRFINVALKDPRQSLSDEILITVTLAALFENMNDMCIMDATLPSAHLRGMFSMINARGPGQFQTAIGRRAFLYAYYTWTATAMPELAVMPHMAFSYLPPLWPDLFEAFLLLDLTQEHPAYRLLPLVHRALILRISSISTLQTVNQPTADILYNILANIATLDEELLAWNASLHGFDPTWGEEDRLYQMLTTSWFRTHRVFLADLSIICHQRLAELEGQSHDKQIWSHVDAAQNAIDEICVRIPYHFGDDNPRIRKPHIKPRIVPDAKVTYLYHSSFEYPLLICSMVWTLPPFRQKGIEAARDQCTRECGLRRPRRTYPKVLVYLTPEERGRYIMHREERHQR